MMAHYLDTSALVKLVVVEPDSDALYTWLSAADRLPVASDLVRTELLRAVRRFPDQMVRARDVLNSITLIRADTGTFERAALLDPVLLRSLDAVHLAAALELGDDLEGVVTYDDRLAEAAALHGARVLAPH